MKLTFDISATEFETVRDILADIVPPGCRVWVFGSRAKNQTRFNSDLDLALECKDKLPPIILHKLKEAFSDSRLPYRVDVLDISDVSENFQTIIRPQAIAFPLAKSTKVPKLRFPEFSGEWVEERFEKQTLSIKSGRSSYQESGEFPVYGSTGQIGFSGKYEFEQPTILVARVGANAGRINRAKGKYGVTDNTLAILLNEHTNFDFVVSLLEKTNLNRFVFGSGQPLITGTMLKRIKCAMPALPEQQKIASFLSAIDTKIAQITKKKALLEYYKRGVMQKLFSQELRFKDAQGKAFPDWVEKRLGALGDFRGGGTPDTKKDHYWIGTIPWISSSDIFENSVQKISITRHITEAAIKDSATKVIPPNSLLIVSRVGVGKFAISVDALCTSQDFCNFTPKDDHVLFLAYWMYENKHKLLSLCQGTSIKGLTTKEFRALKVDLPCVKEQLKIAAFLSAIDLKTDLITTEIDQAQTFKKGLLQQMFI